MAGQLPRPKMWQYPKLLSEHAFDKLRLLDCTLGEVEVAIEQAEVIDWRRPLHVVVLVDNRLREERVITVYEPDPALWRDYRWRR